MKSGALRRNGIWRFVDLNSKVLRTLPVGLLSLSHWSVQVVRLLGTALVYFLVRPAQFRRRQNPNQVPTTDYYLEDLKYKSTRFGGGTF